MQWTQRRLNTMVLQQWPAMPSVFCVYTMAFA